MASPYTNIKFSDAAMPRIAQAAGYSATPYNKEGFQQFLAQNPDAKAKYEQFQQQAVGTMMAARGGVVRFVDGGMVRKYAEGGDLPVGGLALYPSNTMQPTVISPDYVPDPNSPKLIGQVEPTTDMPLPPVGIYPPEYDPNAPIEKPEPQPLQPGEKTAAEEELERLGSIREDLRTDEENKRLEELRDSVPFTYNNQTIRGPEARQRYEAIGRKRADLITAEDRAYANAYRARYGYVPLPAEGADASPDIVKRTTAMQEGLTPEGEPILTEAMTVDAFGVPLDQQQLIRPAVGQTGAVAPTASTAMGLTTEAQPVTATQAATMQAATTQPQVQAELAGLQAAQGTVTGSIAAAEEYSTNVSNSVAAQGEGIVLNNQITRELQNGEIVDPVANAEKAAQFMESIQAATATPSEQATVRGQLEGLYKDLTLKIHLHGQLVLCGPLMLLWLHVVCLRLAWQDRLLYKLQWNQLYQ